MNNGLPLLVTGHLHVRGGQVSELSERRILVGGEEAVSADIFPPDVSYTALGHLHRPQAVDGHERIRYAGAPFPMSGAERGYDHGIVVVDFDQSGVREIRTISIPRSVGFLRVPERDAVSVAKMEELLAGLDVDDPGEARRPFLEVAVRLEAPEPDMRGRIDAALKGKPVRLTSIIRETAGPGGTLAGAPPPDLALEEVQPEEVFARCHAQGYGCPPPPELVAAFREVLARVASGESEEARP